ncbi:Transglutaminase-like superfamily protein [Marinobacter sp. LV10R510-11A]|uniref:transglutaminase family protein n=1 Tax=Marinobacter sp. LV10R510-11A TaxID=1415568 RepID=UPI000BB94269|nr:transglutaminaseTgpA domain-containing protein [Marinobacter sp. LV10R510-11A]SOB75210.1 Transglutaminase-like superfamily protein [Marinobacter sp. LV10R510-11A]
MSLWSRSKNEPEKPSDSLPSRALLWLIASFGLLLTPQLDRLPLWLILVCVALAGWRWLAQHGRVRLPGRWLRTGIMLVLVAIYLVRVQGSFTVDTAASFFVLTVGLKWLETRNARDFYVLFYILVYLATVNFLFHQEIHWALVNIGAIALLLIGLQVLNAPDLPGGMKAGWRRLGVMLLKVLPVVVLLFVFFPRMEPLWSVPLVSGQARTGISDTMRPGDISNLAQSSERAFRVTFGGPMPEYRDRYWRGLILDTLDDGTWRQGGYEPYRSPGRVNVDGGVGELAAREYDVLMEATDQRWAFALEGSKAVSDNVVKEADELFRFRRPADSTIRYRLALENTDKPAAQSLEPGEAHRYLQLPAQGNPRARALADELKRSTDDVGVIQSLLSRFREQPYFYTLRPPKMPNDGIDSLLFDEKRGFCAHYAGATTFVLRSAGIPARIVVGYQGGESGAGNEYLIVRQYDAHAWVEAWVAGQGWIRIDPTAAIAPDRIELGLRDAVADEGSFLENNWASAQRYGDVAIIQWASLQLDRINYQWQRWVVGYQGQSQLDLMSRLPGGFGMRELGYFTAGIIGAALLIAGLISALQMRRGVGRDRYARVLGAWYQLCGRAGVPVRHGETPAALASRLAVAEPAVADSARLFARMVNSHYYMPHSRPQSSPQSGPHSARDDSDDLKRLRRLLATMKRQLHRAGKHRSGIFRASPQSGKHSD